MLALLDPTHGVDAVTGPLLLQRRITYRRRPLFMFGPYAVRGAVDLVLAVVTAVPLPPGRCCSRAGLFTPTGNVTFSSLVQSRVPEDQRGLAFAGFDVPEGS